MGPYKEDQFGMSNIDNMMNNYTPAVNQSTAATSGGSSLLSSLGSGLLGGIGSLLGAGINVLGQRAQRRWEEEMWNKENEYNLPENQLQRLLDAGVNPAAAMDSMLGGNGSISATAPSNPGSNVMTSDLGSLMANSANMYMERELAKSQVNKNNADAEFVRSQDVDQKMKNATAKERYQAELDSLVQQNRISRSNANILEASEYWKKEGAYIEYRQQLQSLSNSEKQFEVLSGQVYREYAAAWLAMQQAGLAQADIDKVYSDIGLNNAQIERISHEIGKIDAEASSTWKDVDAKQITNGLLQIQEKYAKSAEAVFDSMGINLQDSVWQNFVRLCAEGKREAASQLLEDNWEVLVHSDANAKYAREKLNQQWVDMSIDAVTEIAKTVGMVYLGKGMVKPATGVTQGSTNGTWEYNLSSQGMDNLGH